MSKVTVKEVAKIDTNFACGDFLITREGWVRQVVKGSGVDGYMIIDPQTGTRPSGATGTSAHKAVEQYTRANGPVRRAKLVELIVEETREAEFKG